MITFYGGSGQLYCSAKTSYSHIRSDVGELEPSQPEALGAIVLSFASIEAFLNELGEMVISDPDGAPWRPTVINEYGNQWSKLEEAKCSTSSKFESACNILSGNIKKGSKLYQSFSDLCCVRNAFMLFRPDQGKFHSDGSVIDLSKVHSRLRNRNILPNNDSVIANWVTRIQNRAAARWACNTASACVLQLLIAIPNEPEFKSIHLRGLEQVFVGVN